MKHAAVICTTIALSALLPSAVRGQAACAGDCDGDGRVEVAEVVTLVNIALGDAPLSSCPAGDLDHNDRITVDELVAAVSNVLQGCAGSETTLSGDAVKGPVRDAEVAAFAVGPEGERGAEIGSATTDESGNFHMALGDFSGPLMLQMTGGSFDDEATGMPMAMGANDMMTAMIPDIAAGAALSGAHITPLTSMAQRMAANMPGGMTPANMAQSNAAMGSYFGVSDIIGVHPMDPTAPGSGASADQDQRNYGMAMAAMSELAGTAGMTSASGMVTAMMNDASDGVMDGMMDGRSIDMGGMGGMMHGRMMPRDAGTSGMAAAMMSFVESAENRSGVTLQDMQPMIDKLETSNGLIQ
jgi:hypothetical protein